MAPKNSQIIHKSGPWSIMFSRSSLWNGNFQINNPFARILPRRLLIPKWKKWNELILIFLILFYYLTRKYRTGQLGWIWARQVSVLGGAVSKSNQDTIFALRIISNQSFNHYWVTSLDDHFWPWRHHITWRSEVHYSS